MNILLLIFPLINPQQLPKMLLFRRMLIVLVLLAIPGNNHFILLQEQKPRIIAQKISRVTGQQLFNKWISEGECDSAFLNLNIVNEKYIVQQDWKGCVRNIIRVANCFRLSDIEKTRGLLAKAEHIMEQHDINDQLLQSDILYQKGFIALEDKEYELSVKYLKQTVDTRKKLDIVSDSILPFSYNNIAFSYLKLRNYQGAIDYYQQAIVESVRLGYANDNELADYYQNLALTYLLDKEYERSWNWVIKTLVIKEKHTRPNVDDLSNLYIIAGSIAKEIGKFDESIEFYNKAEKIALTKYSIFHMFMGYIYTNKGVLYQLIGEYHKSLQYHLNALKVYDFNNYNDIQKLPNALNNIGNLYVWMGEYKKALEYLLKNISLINKNNLRGTPGLYSNCAICYYNLGNNIEADKYFQITISLIINNTCPDMVELGKQYLYYGRFCLKTGKIFDGLRLYELANNILLKKLGPKNGLVSSTYEYFADYYNENGDFKKALSYYQRSIIANVEDFNDQDIYSNPGILNSFSDIKLSTVLKKKAECFKMLYTKTHKPADLEKSLDTYELTINLIEKIRSEYLTEDSRLFLTDHESETYLRATNIACELFSNTGDPIYQSAAFKFAEKSKSANLLSSLRQIEAKTFGGIPDSLQVKEKQLKEQISYLDNLIYNENNGNKDQSKINEWENKLFELNNQHDALLTYFEKNYPKFYSLKYNNSVIDINALQKNLGDKQTLIEYVLSDSILFIFLCDSKEFKELRVQIDTTFFQNLNFVIKSITINDYRNFLFKKYVEFTNAAYYLYSKLLLPVEKYIKTNEIILVPDKDISYLPFEALVNSNAVDERKGYRALKYLIFKYTFSYSYSATLLFNNIEKSGTGNKLLAFAPKYDDFDKLDSIHLAAINKFKNSLVDLPFVDNEITDILQIYGGKAFKGEEATEDHFKANVAESGIIHLAMHSVIDSVNPMYSKLVFTQTNEGKEDGLLNAFEIYNLRLKAKLAVLSACNTGYGKLFNGEGVMSFARGFLYAGCRSVLMTLWTVEDRAGYMLTSSFYRELNSGKEVNASLRSAKIEFLKNADQLRSHPYFWAAYVNIGSTDKVFISTAHTEKNKSIIYFTISAGVIIVVIIILLVNNRLKKRKMKRWFTKNELNI